MSYLMDEFMESLPPWQKSLIQFLIPPMDYTANAINQRRAAAAALANIHEPPSETLSMAFNELRATVPETSILTTLATQFTGAMDAKQRRCLLPNLAEIHNLHREYPVFGFIVTAHDMICQHCKSGDATALQERKRQEQASIQELPGAEQFLLVKFGRALADRLAPYPKTFDRAVKAARDEMLSELAQPLSEHARQVTMENLERIVCDPYFAALHIFQPCPLGEFMSRELLIWFLNHPFMFAPIYRHATRGKCGRLRGWRGKFETFQFRNMSNEVRRSYEAASRRVPMPQ